MPKIYIITAGCYSDYHICAATTDKEKAERLKILFENSYSGSNIEEFEDGVFDTVLSGEHKPYLVIFKSDNSIELIRDADIEYFEEGVHIYRNGWRIGGGSVHCLARDEEHAKKIAIDRYAKAKAEALGL